MTLFRTIVDWIDARTGLVSALVETAGDMEKATEYLRKKGLASAAKKEGRVATEGLVHSYIHAGGRIGVLVEVNCETDFVARGEHFTEFVREVALQIAAAARLPPLVPGTRLHLGFAIAVALAVGLAVLLRRARVGFRIRAVGASPVGARWPAMRQSGGSSAQAAADIASAISRLIHHGERSRIANSEFFAIWSFMGRESSGDAICCPDQERAMPEVHHVTHPLVQHKLTLMRDKDTSTNSFRRLLGEISMLMAYEVTRDMPTQLIEIETPLEKMRAPVIEGRKTVFVSIMRAGAGFLDAVPVVVIAEHAVDAQRGPQLLQDLEARGYVLALAVRVVAAEKDQVGAERHGRADDRTDVLLAEVGAQVNVGDKGDGRSAECSR